MSESKYIYRKDIAILLECNVTQVRDSEKRWGIDVARRDLSSRQARYLRTECLRILAERGILG